MPLHLHDATFLDYASISGPRKPGVYLCVDAKIKIDDTLVGNYSIYEQK